MNEMVDNYTNIIANKYALFKGRSGKAEFWQFLLVFIIINLILSIILKAVGGIKILGFIFMIVSILFPLTMFIPTLALSVRRMHDIGKGGGWVLINLIPVLGSIWFLILALQGSEPTANRFDTEI